MQQSQTFVQGRVFCLPHLHSSRRPRYGGSRWNIAIPFGMEKLEWLGYPMVKNSKIFLFVLMQLTNVTDTQTDTHTPHDGIGRAYA